VVKRNKDVTMSKAVAYLEMNVALLTRTFSFLLAVSIAV